MRRSTVGAGVAGAWGWVALVALPLMFDLGCNRPAATPAASGAVAAQVSQGPAGTPGESGVPAQESPASSVSPSPGQGVAGAVSASPGGLVAASPTITFAEGFQITARMKAIVNKAADDMTFHAEAVKPPYPWTIIPAMYDDLVKGVGQGPGADAFWLAHCRELAIPLAHLSRSVARDPDNPYEPDLMTMNEANPRGDAFDETVKKIFNAVRAANPRPTGVVQLLEAILLIMCEEGQKAVTMLDALPLLSDDPAHRVERGLRLLARTMHAYGSKKPPRPPALMRDALAGFAGHLDDKVTEDDRGWALILVYAAAPSLQDKAEAKPDLGADIVETGLKLLGLVPGPGTGERVPQDPVVDGELRRVVRDAAHRALDPLAQDLTGPEPPHADEMVTGLIGARWLVLVARSDKDEGPLWYSLYRDTLTAGARQLGASTDAGVKARLAALDEALAARQTGEATGLMSACRARLAQIRQDAAAAAAALATARQRAQTSGLAKSEPAIFDTLAH